MLRLVHPLREGIKGSWKSVMYIKWNYLGSALGLLCDLRLTFLWASVFLVVEGMWTDF